MAATAWYHKRLPATVPPSSSRSCKEVEKFAIGDYAAALQQGGRLDPAVRQKSPSECRDTSACRSTICSSPICA